MSKRELEGEWDTKKGKFREVMGKLTGSRKQQLQGKLEQAKGKGKKAIGRAGRKSRRRL